METFAELWDDGVIRKNDNFVKTICSIFYCDVMED